MEASREDGIDFVVVVTSNTSHYPICRVFLEHGINVMCDKPLTVTSAEAEHLQNLAEQRHLLFGVTYTYTGYPAVKQIAHLVRSGEIGDIRFVHAEYLQEWMVARVRNAQQLKDRWRTNPAHSGMSNCIGDIGTHIEHMVASMTGMHIVRLSARLDTFIDGHTLDDNASVMVEYDSGAKGLYWASQISVGSSNGLRIRLIGSKGTIEWFQEDPDHFKLVRIAEPVQIYSRGRNQFAPTAQSFSRIPGGHVEGVYEAFANLYKAFNNALLRRKSGESLSESDMLFPTVQDGVSGVRFIEACVESSKKDSAWVPLRQS
jgi:predicted dehydrogenase